MIDNKYNKNDIDIISEAYTCCSKGKCVSKSEDEETSTNYAEIIENLSIKCFALIKKAIKELNIRDKDELIDAIVNIGSSVGDDIKDGAEKFSWNIEEDYATGDEDIFNYYFDEDEESERRYDIEAEVRPGKKYGEASFLDNSIQNIYNAKTFDEAAEIFRSLVNNSRIYKGSKDQILKNIANIEAAGKNLIRLQTYATNCMFKMKKMGLH